MSSFLRLLLVLQPPQGRCRASWRRRAGRCAHPYRPSGCAAHI